MVDHEAPEALGIFFRAGSGKMPVDPSDERAEFMAKYKAAAGFAIEKLNSSPRTIAEGATVELAEKV